MLRSPLCRASLVLPICLAFAASCADSRPKDREEQVAQRRVVILDTLANGLFDVLGLLTVDPDTIVLLDGGAEEHLLVGGRSSGSYRRASWPRPG